ncbi:uncharacterized protein LOC143028380 [Oratosquilla oratoria]|uniref:uncharacterized protein LOC143028380 n=1 Tax=Oratosquilla oratoria TaxID=337810 RepID=UPI003F76CB13
MDDDQRVYWNRGTEAALIDKIRDFPSLWDHTHPDYLKKSVRRYHFNRIAAYMMEHYPILGDVTADHVRLKFSNLRSYYIRERKKQEKSSETDGPPTPKWELFSHLTFLDGLGTEIPSICNLQEPAVALSLNKTVIDEEDHVNCENSRIFWTRDAEAALIERVKECRVLWDFRHKLYQKKSTRSQCFQEIAAYLRTNYPNLGPVTQDHVRVKFGNMKSYYIKEKRRINAKQSKYSRPVTSKWEWYEMLSFVDDASPSFLEALIPDKMTSDESEVEEMVLSPFEAAEINSGDIQRMCSTPEPQSDDDIHRRKKHKVNPKKESTTEPLLEHLDKSLEEEDIAHAASMLVKSCVRKYGHKDQLVLMGKLVALLEDFDRTCPESNRDPSFISGFVKK